MTIQEKIKIIRQAQENFSRRDEGTCFLSNYSFDSFNEWFHLVKFCICIWLDWYWEPWSYKDEWDHDHDVVAIDNYHRCGGGCDYPSWAADWDEWRVGIGFFRNWFYTITDGGNY